MYLLDTNVFLEILLRRKNSNAAKHVFASYPPADLFITDFSLHSIGIILFKRKRHDAFERFIKDIVIRTGIGVIELDMEDVPVLTRATKRFDLDFDDAYQYAVAEINGLDIISFDADFDRTEKGRKVPDADW